MNVAYHVLIIVAGILCLAGLIKLALWMLGFGGKDAT